MIVPFTASRRLLAPWQVAWQIHVAQDVRIVDLDDERRHSGEDAARAGIAIERGERIAMHVAEANRMPPRTAIVRRDEFRAGIEGARDCFDRRGLDPRHVAER